MGLTWEHVPDRRNAMTLNERALRVADRLAAEAETLRIAVSQAPLGARLIDCGVQAEGGLAAGIALARVCLADLA
jgi:methenyltetrahydromethanopterin cyclohydrolase